MPKILSNVKEQLLLEAKRQTAENGYQKTTIRSVAAACGLGVGTVYNYFPSKEMLIASFMLEDWLACLEQMRSHPSDSAELLLRGIWEDLRAFTEKHESLFSDDDAAKVFVSAFHERHQLLKEQIASILLPACHASPLENKPLLAAVLAESILSHAVQGYDFEDLLPIFLHMLCTDESVSH